MTGPPEAPGLDLSRLSPADAAVALRSFGRRYRALLTTLGDEERPDDLVHRAGPDGRSALDHAAGVAESVATIGAALRSILVEDGPALPAGALGALAPPAVAARSDRREVEAVLDHLSLEATALADVADSAASEDWARTGMGAGDGQPQRALDVLRAGVAVGANGLRAVERALALARARR